MARSILKFPVESNKKSTRAEVYVCDLCAYFRERSPDSLMACIENWEFVKRIYEVPSQEPISDNRMRMIFSKVSEGCGIRVNASRCRDTYIQMLLDAGAKRENVSVAAGHRSDATTMRHYGRPRSAQAAADIKEVWKKEGMKMSNDEKNSETVRVTRTDARIDIGGVNLANGRGFEPPACSLGGCRHIQTRPPVQ